MVDPNHASRVSGSGERTLRVNNREVRFELSSGRILAGPPGLVGKWICSEQLADMIAAGDSVLEHLYPADTEADIRLARMDYLTAKAKEQKGGFAVGSHVKYGTHGVFRVHAFHADKDIYALEAEGCMLHVPRTRLVQEAQVLPPDISRQEVRTVRRILPREDELAEDSEDHHEAEIEIADVELEALIRDAVNKYIDQHRDEIIARLANHPLYGGKDLSVQ